LGTFDGDYLVCTLIHIPTTRMRLRGYPALPTKLRSSFRP